MRTPNRLTPWPLARPHALAALIPLLALTGCSSAPTALESSLGASVRLAVERQKVPAPGERGPQLTDGVIAVHGVDRYQQSYERPPAPVSVLNLLAGSGSASATPSGMPR